MLKRWIVLVTLIVLLLLAGGALLWLQFGMAHQFAGVVLDPPQSAANITLTDETSQLFSLNALRGKWILLTYGYTSCPDVCPLTLDHLRQVKSLLGAQAANVRVVFVSVDPQRDTPQVLNGYVKHFGSDFKGLTGTAGAIAQAADAYNVRYELKPKESGGGYTVSHTAFVYLIDPEFRQRITYPFGVEPVEIANDLKYLMAQETAAQ